MIRSAPFAILALWAVPDGPVLAAADGWGMRPFEIVRELQTFHNQAVLEPKSGRAEQDERIAKIAARLSDFDPRVWAEPKNARAAVLYVLSGGDPRVLRRLLGARVALGIDKKLVEAVVAYGESRDDKAIELFKGIDMSSLDQSIVGQVALVRALLIAEKDPSTAIALFDMARISASGTIVEEAALRREAIIAAKTSNLDAFEALSSQYFRRFASSTFAQSFQSQLAEEVLAHYARDSDRLAKLETALLGLPEAVRREICVVIAEEGIAAANVEMVRFAVRLATHDSHLEPLDAMRLRLFEAAAAIVTADSEKGLVALMSIDRRMISAREEALLDAALAVAREVRRPPLPARGAVPAANAEKTVADEPANSEGSSVIGVAKEAISDADKLLSEAVK